MERLPFGDLPLAADDVQVERDVEAVDELRPRRLDEPGRVLGDVLRRLGNEVAEVVEKRVAHSVSRRDAALLDDAPKQRVEVLAVALEPQVEGEVVDPGAEVVDLVGWDADVDGDVAHGRLHRVAQADALDRGSPVDRPAADRHWIHVLEQPGIRAELLHVAAEREQDRNRAKPAHDAADAERVGDRLPQAELLRYLEVDDCSRPVTADLEHRHDVVRSVDRLALVERRPDPGLRPELLHETTGDDVRGLEAVLVDVHEDELRRVAQRRVGEDVRHQVLREHGRAGPDESDRRHCPRFTLTERLRVSQPVLSLAIESVNA